MARTREFDVGEAVTRATHLFWHQGYEATSMRELAERLGVGQGSLYAAFGSKDGLYRAALEHYRDTVAAVPAHAAGSGGSDGGGDVRAMVRAVLLDRVRVAAEGGQGCLLVDAAAERLPGDPATGALVRDATAAIREALTRILTAAARRGEIPAGRDPAALAGFLVTFLNGLLISSKVTPDPEALAADIEVALAVLSHPGP
ncbi:TetR/AcrR family transcriptional regulator [Actinoplanes sp. DH11]|uniref:TetR/AcrR family transcriptional regulator n=1 Tax=Actinoplanes sp. DH11 TaxID=2857011 RepID=UPI001E4CCF80|nr:TetR/AcrR family transcriptional regulator [Actinoplanes sp. DH11]